MSNAKKCDRCGKFYSENEKKFKINIGSNKYIPSWIKILDVNDRTIFSLDLCEQCMKDLYHWLCNEQEVECELDG